MSALGHIGLHAGEDAQAVGELQSVAHPAALGGEITVQVGKLEGVEVLGEAESVQPGTPGLVEEPVGVYGGKGQLFGQLSVSVKIKTQENNLLSYDSRVEASKAAVIHKKETARNSRSL